MFAMFTRLLTHRLSSLNNRSLGLRLRRVGFVFLVAALTPVTLNLVGAVQPAQAQSTTVPLVSNVNGYNGSTYLADRQVAQAFTTGSANLGYTVHTIDIKSWGGRGRACGDRPPLHSL